MRLGRSRRASRVALAVAVALVVVGGAAASPARRGAAVPQWALVLAPSSGLEVLRAGDRSARALTRVPSGSHYDDQDPVWSPDGRRVAFVRSDRSFVLSHVREELYIVAAKGGPSRRLASGVGYLEAVAWSPDGARVAFSRSCSQPSGSCRPGVYVVRSDGTGVRLLFASSERGFASWSPDGRRLVCLCAGAIYTFDSNGGTRHVLSTKSDGTLGRASWSPDGRLIAFGRHCSEPSRVGGDVYCEVAVMNVDGTHKRTLLRRRGGAAPEDLAPSWPSWFADSTLLIGLWGYAPDCQVVSVDPRTGAQRILYHGVAYGLTLGPGHTFGFFAGGPHLLLVDGAGKVLLRRELVVGAPSALHIG